jgi:hypothetical protein
MSNRPDHSHYVRRVVLPSGKTIEVVYFDDAPAAEQHRSLPAPAPQPERSDLHVCGACGSDLVYPVDWDEAGATHWEVSLRCPNCEWSGAGIFEQDVVDRFDEELDRGTESLVRDLRRLIHANMEEDIDRFVTALQAGHIVPEDF